MLGIKPKQSPRREKPQQNSAQTRVASNEQRQVQNEAGGKNEEMATSPREPRQRSPVSMCFPRLYVGTSR